MHVERKIIDVDEVETVKEYNDSSIIFKSLKSCQENATIKSRQRWCNAIKFKKSNTLIQTKKSLFKVNKVSTISTIRYTWKHKSEHWLGPYLSNVNKKKEQVYESFNSTKRRARRTIWYNSYQLRYSFCLVGYELLKNFAN